MEDEKLKKMTTLFIHQGFNAIGKILFFSYVGRALHLAHAELGIEGVADVVEYHKQADGAEINAVNLNCSLSGAEAHNGLRLRSAKDPPLLNSAIFSLKATRNVAFNHDPHKVMTRFYSALSLRLYR
jgi:hypothetical protein